MTFPLKLNIDDAPCWCQFEAPSNPIFSRHSPPPDDIFPFPPPTSSFPGHSDVMPVTTLRLCGTSPILLSLPNVSGDSRTPALPLPHSDHHEGTFSFFTGWESLGLLQAAQSRRGGPPSNRLPSTPILPTPDAEGIHL